MSYNVQHPPEFTPPVRRSVLQDWVMQLPFMQQSVLIAAMRGPDGVVKDHPSKALCKWLRRCIVISAFDGKALTNPYYPGGGSYTGPSVSADQCERLCDGHAPQHCDETCPDFAWEGPMKEVRKAFMKSQDNLPLHFYLHFLHAAEIIGYKHPNLRIREWWFRCYCALAHDLHLNVETEEALDHRLNDNEAQWRADESRFKK